MGIEISDGTGKGGKAEVKGNRLQTKAITEAEIVSESENGNAYIIVSQDATPAVSEYTLYFKNTSTTHDFVVQHIDLYTEDSDVRWLIHEVTGTAAGASSLTPYNLNMRSGNTASAIVRGNGSVTGLTSVTVLHTARNNKTLPFDGALVMGLNDAIAIEYNVGTGGDAEINFVGFYRAKD